MAFMSDLIIFFVVCSTVWLLGNDNLGAAVRLRVYNYIAIFISCMMVFQWKPNNAFLLPKQGWL